MLQKSYMEGREASLCPQSVFAVPHDRSRIENGTWLNTRPHRRRSILPACPLTETHLPRLLCPALASLSFLTLQTQSQHQMSED